MTCRRSLRHALLALSDGSVFGGFSHGFSGDAPDGEVACVGEVVFNTAMTGYQEILSDPSYHSQIVVFTCPHIGNVGATARDDEATDWFVAGMVARQICARSDNWRAQASLPEYLRARRVPAIEGVDTRAVTRRLRDGGAMGGCLLVPPAAMAAVRAREEAVRRARAFAGLDGAMLAAPASRTASEEWSEGEWRRAEDGFARGETLGEVRRRVTVLDCGTKRNILRALTQRGCAVTVLPYESDYAAVLETRPDGVLISNGPGDPAPCENARALARRLLDDEVPLFGLCLGHQIVAAALGARTEKMKFGHHGANHPVLDVGTGRVLITSQNHGFAVNAESLPPQARVTHRSLFDGSLQGIACDAPPVLTFQGHPEASPGPRDAAVMFDRFARLMEARRAAADGRA